MQRGQDALRYNTGDNLLALFGLDAASRVLVVGGRLEQWVSRFRGCEFVMEASAPTRSHPFDLVLVDAATVQDACLLEETFRRLKGMVSAAGTIVVFASNAWSLRHLKGKFLGQGSTEGSRFSHGAVLRGMVGAGFEVQHFFVPMGGLYDADELAIVGTELMEVPSRWNAVFRFAHNLGMFHKVADGFIIVACAAPLESQGAIRSIAALLSASKGTAPELRVERVDVRLRGALVLFLHDPAGRRFLVARLASDPDVAAVLARNSRFLEFLHSDVNGATGMADLLPVPLLHCDSGGGAFFVETYLHGVVAWKALGDVDAERLTREAVGFLVGLRSCTARRVSLSDQPLHELTGGNDTWFTGQGKDLEAGVATIHRALRAALAGKEVELVASHGDFGYGNILVDPGTGRLAGVIDWDTGRRSELPGVDLYNFLLQKERVERNCGVWEAWQHLGDDIFQRHHDQWSALGVTRDLCRPVAHLALLRYMARSARYPAVFDEERADYLKLLALLAPEIRL